MHGSTTEARGGLIGCSEPLATAYDLAVLDLDGVLYIGPDAVPGAPQALAAARRAGLRTCFVTNNASRTASSVAEHLVDLGIPADADEVVTSAQVASTLLARRLPPGAAVLVVGGEGLRSALTERGLRPVRTVEEEPQAVVQGFNPDLSWRDLAEGTRAVRSGLFWMATNLDLTVPTPYGPAPGNGALVGLVAGAAGREPDEVAGKPKPGSFVEAARRYGSERPLVVGDRLDTDLEGARAAGQDGLLVLTGVSCARDVISCPAHRRPAYLGRDLTALTQPHPEVTVQPLDSGSHERAGGRAGRATGFRTAGFRAVAGQARVVAEDAVLRVEEPGPDALDVLRAAAQAAWAWADRIAGMRATAPADGAVPGRAADRPAFPAPVPDAVLDVLRTLEPGAAWAR